MSIKMRRWILCCVLAVLAVVLYVTFSNWRETRARHRREAMYQSALASYQGALPSGILREQVEAYLQSRSLHFERLCCTYPDSTTSELVEIGREPSPWYCSRSIVYVEFRFSTTDRLKQVALHRRLSLNRACLR